MDAPVTAADSQLQRAGQTSAHAGSIASECMWHAQAPVIGNLSRGRVIFDTNARLVLADEIKRLGCTRAVIFIMPQILSVAHDLAEQIGNLCAGIFSETELHPSSRIADRAVDYVKQCHADCLVSLGDYSGIGLSKAVALRTDLPQIALPLGFSGSEVTALHEEMRNERIEDLYSPAVQPEVILYDARLTLSWPTKRVAASGMVAMSHAVEALYAAHPDPTISILAEECIRIFTAMLPQFLAKPLDLEIRSRLQQGAWLAGLCLNVSGRGFHHVLCKILGNSFHISFWRAHGVLLPYTLGYNVAAAPDAVLRIGQAMEANHAVQGMFDFVQRLTIPASLAELGFKRSDIEHAADLVLTYPIRNPRPLNRAAICTLLEYALVGTPPPWSFQG